MKIFIDGVDRIGFKGFGTITAASTEAQFRDALAVEPQIAQFFTPEFLATLHPNAGATKQAGDTAKASGKSS